MATEKEIIVKIEVDNRKAIPQIVEMTKELDGLKKERQDLKKEMKDEANQTDENYQKLVTLDTQIRETSKGIKDLTSAVDANIKQQDAQEGSLVKMRAQLKQLVYEYDNLSAAARESADGLEKAQKITDLRQNLKEIEGNIGDFRRNVGDYRNAINEALNGNSTLKNAFGELRNELAKITFQQRQQVGAIKEQKAALDELARTVGTDSQKYKESEAELQRMQNEYQETTQTIKEMTKAGSDMKDAIGDVNRSLSEGAKDNPTLQLMAQSAQIAADSYAVLKAGMTTLGIESEDLMNVFAKLQIIQQGVNSVTRIANALQKESLLRQKMLAAWTTIQTTYTTALAAAKKKDAAASVQAAAGNAALAAGEGVATTASLALTAALKTVGVAIKSIPVIGWILTAVAALGTVIGFIVKANKESKKGNDELERRKNIESEINEIHKEALESTQKEVVEMEQNVKHLKEMKEGTEEWDEMVTQVATDLGVDVEWLKKNIDKVDALKDAWIELQKSMALGEAAAKKMADNQIKQATIAADIMKIMQGTDAKKRTEELQKQLGLTYKQADAISKAYHKQGGNSKEYQKAVQSVMTSLKDEQKVLEGVMDTAYEKQKNAQDDLSKTAEGHIGSVSNKAHKAAKSAQKDIKDLGEQFEDLLVEGMVDGIEKQIKQVEREAEKWVEKMKEAREKDLKNKDLYDSMILEKERQTQEKVKKIRQTEYARISAETKKLMDSYNQLWDNSSSSALGKHISALDSVTNKLSDDIKTLNQSIKELNNSRLQMMYADAFRNSADALLETIKGEDFQKKVQAYLEKAYNLKPKEAQKVTENILKELKNGFKNISDEPLELEIGETKINASSFLKNFATAVKDSDLTNVVGDILDTREVYDSLKAQEIELKEERRKAEEEAYNKINKTVSKEEEALMIERERSKIYGEITKESQEIALNQAESGQVAEIPEDLSNYIDLQIENLENERAKLQGDINSYKEMMAKGPFASVEDEMKKKHEAEVWTLIDKEEEIKKLEEIEAELDKYYAKKEKQTKRTDLESKSLSVEYGDTEGFFSTDQINAYKQAIKEVEDEMKELEQAKSDLSQKLRDDKGIMSEDEVNQAKINIATIEADLEELAEKKVNLTKWAERAEKGFGFFDNTEIIKEEVEIEKLQNKIQALQLIKQRGSELSEKISAKEQELADNSDALQKTEEELYILNQVKAQGIDVTSQIIEKEKELERLREVNSDENVSRSKKEIDDMRTELAEIGYTSEDEIDKTIDMFNGKVKQHAKTTEKLMKQTAASVLSSFATIANALQSLFEEIGEDNAEMTNFLESMAYITIGVNLAAGIAEAVAAGAGQIFPYNLAAIASGVSAVLSAIASAISTYKQYHKQVSSPSFATGGVIGGRTAKTKEEGKRDDVPIWASRGEYIINAEKVKEYGVDFFDSINFGKKLRKLNFSGKYAEGGMVSQTTIQNVTTNTQSYDMLVDALEHMPSPEVSVVEISHKQRKVKTKEAISKK